MQFEDEEARGWRQDRSAVVGYRGAASRVAASKRGKAALFVALACALLVGFVSDLFVDRADNGVLDSVQYSSPRLLTSKEAAGDDKAGDGLTFVFIMGVEGTGHHFFDELLGHSPNMIEMEDLGVCSRDGKKSGELARVSAAFFGVDNLKLFNSGTSKATDKLGVFNPTPGAKEYFDADLRYDEVVDMLRTTRSKFEERRAREGKVIDGRTHVAINANSCHGPGVSMMSYPDYKGPDRALQNFNLDFFYNACSDAGVKCKHLYIYRDPYDVIRSTSNRHFNENVYDALRLYTSVLQQVHSQMVSFPERNLGCFGFLDPAGFQIQQDWERFGSLFGWETFQKFMSTSQEINTKSPAPMSEDDKSELVPDRLQAMMRALEDIHGRVIDYCYSSIGDAEPYRGVADAPASITEE